MKLLSPGHTNAKIAKNSSKGEYLSYILHLAPYTLAGINVCPAASKGCAQACLNTAGRGAFNSIQQARIKKTQFFHNDKTEFMKQLIKEISAGERKAIRENKKLVIRLNGTSDIDWENILIENKNVFQMFPNTQFYDYTKRPDRILRNRLSNYHLTFSMSESNEKVSLKVLKAGKNVAVVFKNIPEEYKGYKVINGDSHDLRFLDETSEGLVIGLLAKGKAKRDNTGFVK